MAPPVVDWQLFQGLLKDSFSSEPGSGSLEGVCEPWRGREKRQSASAGGQWTWHPRRTSHLRASRDSGGAPKLSSCRSLPGGVTDLPVPLSVFSLCVPLSSPLPLAGPYLLVNCCFVFPSLPLRARLLLWSFSPAAGSRWLHSQDHDGALPEPLPQLSSPSGVSLAFSTPGVCPPGLAVDLNYLMASFFVAPGPFFSVLDAEQKTSLLLKSVKQKHIEGGLL